MRRVGGGTTFLLAMLIATGTAACAGSPDAPPAPSPGVSPVVQSGAGQSSAASTAAPSPASASASATPLVGSEIEVAHPTALSVEGSTIWAVADRDVARIEPATGSATSLGIGNGDQLAAIATTPDAIWVADFDGQNLLRIDPASGSVAARIGVDSPIEPLAVDGTIWVTNHHEGSVTRVSAKTNKVIDRISIGDPGEGGPGTLVSGHGSVWVADPNIQQVVRLDPKTAKVTARITVPEDFGACGETLVTDDALWMTGCSQSTDVARIDPATNKVVARVELGGNAIQPVLVDGAIWVAVLGSRAPGELVRIDPDTNTVTRRIPVDGLVDLGGSVLKDGTLWVANGIDRLIGVPVSELAAS